MNKKLLFRLVALMAAMMCALGASAAEAYACYTSSNTTLTFYYDNQRSSRSGRTYDLNTGSDDPIWAIGGEWGIGTSPHVTKVVFDPSFAGARPESTCSWFYEMENLESIEGMEYLNTSEVTNMSRMFNYCSKLTSLDLNRFNTSNVTDMERMFAGCKALTSLDLSCFNTSNVTDMERMFAECKALTSLDLGTFNTSKVTIMESMFDGNNNLRTIYVRSLWSTEAVRLSWRIFGDCYSLMGCRGTTYNSSNPQDKRYARIDGGPSEPGYFTLTGTTAYACYTSSNKTLTFYYDTDRVNRRGRTYDLNTIFNSPDWYYDDTNVDVTKVVIDHSFVGARPESTHGWFYEMSKLESITGLEYLNTSEVIDMRNMFAGCIQLTSLDVSGFNTSKVTDMQSLFDGCLFVTSLDLSSFNTSQVIDMDWMFRNCTNLRTIYVGDGWSTDRVTQSELMFLDCTSLVGGKGSTYNSSNPKDKTYARIDGGPSKPGYFTDKSAVLRGDVNGDGEVNIADVNALIDIILSGKGGTAAADVNGDGEVNIADVNALIDMILGGSWN